MVSQFRNTTLEDTEQFRAAPSTEMFFYCKFLTAYYWVWQLAEQDQHCFSQVFETPPSLRPYLSRHQEVQIQPKAPWTNLADFSWRHHFLGLSIGRKLTRWPRSVYNSPSAWYPSKCKRVEKMTSPRLEAEMGAVQHPAEIRWKILRL